MIKEMKINDKLNLDNLLFTMGNVELDKNIRLKAQEIYQNLKPELINDYGLLPLIQYEVQFAKYRC